MSLDLTLRHNFGGFALDLALSAPPGLVALFGRSGAGKTSVLNAVAGLFRPDCARISLNGRVLTDTERGTFLPPSTRRVGYVFQDARLFPHLSVRKNLLYGQRFLARGAAPPDLDEITGLLGIAPLLDRSVTGLSGGERQRVAIGRALLRAPEVLLMDEPFAALDDARKAELLPYVERLRDRLGLPILYVSHSLPEVARLATTVAVISNGRIARMGPAREVLADPTALPAFGPREAGAVVTATLTRHLDDDGLSALMLGDDELLLPRIAAAPGTKVRLRIAANDVMLAKTKPEGLSALNVLPARITEVREGGGPGAAVALRLGADQILARVTRRSLRELGLGPGEACFAILKATALAPADVVAETVP
ncbi:MAG: molybdenum ABC transporter ATP-binding protein [Pseudomonadota bacterium]